MELLLQIKSDNITREHIVNIKISGIHIAPDMEMEMFGWGVSEIKILGQYVYSFGVTKIDIIYLPFTECKKQFDNYFLDDKVNACARTKNEHQKISLVNNFVNLFLKNIMIWKMFEKLSERFCISTPYYL